MLWVLLLIAACGESGPGEPPQTVQPETAKPPESPPCELIMGWDPWEPYQYEIAGGQVFGLDVDLLTAVVRNADCDIAFRKGTWRDLLRQLREGEIDLLGGATRTPAREEFAYFTDPYRDEQFTLYVTSNRLEELQDKSFETLLEERMRFGVVEDYLYGDPVVGFQDDPQYQDRFQYSSMSEIIFSRLLDGEVDVIIEDKYVGASIIRHKSLSGTVSTHPWDLTSHPVSIMVSKASVDEAQFSRLNRSVQELKASGAIDKILAQYLDL
jgi:polar amino acid transport system substrate-binding protein